MGGRGGEGGSRAKPGNQLVFYIRLNSNHSCGVVIVYNSGVMRWRRRGYNYMKITCHISSFKSEYDPRNPYYRSTYIEHITGTTRLSTVYRTSDCQLYTERQIVNCIQNVRLSTVYRTSDCQLDTERQIVNCIQNVRFHLQAPYI